MTLRDICTSLQKKPKRSCLENLHVYEMFKTKVSEKKFTLFFFSKKFFKNITLVEGGNHFWWLMVKPFNNYSRGITENQSINKNPE